MLGSSDSSLHFDRSPSVMAENQIDLEALAVLLPDTVKRKILHSVEVPSGHPAQHQQAQLYQQDHMLQDQQEQQQQQQQQQQLLQPQATADLASVKPCISSRLLQLPRLKAGACVVDDVLRPSEAQQVAAAVESWLASHGRRPGMGTAGSGGLWHDMAYRGDVTSWVTAQQLKDAGQPLIAAVVQLMVSLKQQLTEQGFDVSGRCSIQLACYPGGGARYVRHQDASPSVPGRTVTALLYLNPDWDVQRDGGQLALYNIVPHALCNSSSSSTTNCTAVEGSDAPAAGYVRGEPAVLVAPLAGRLLVFDAQLPHEVLPAQRHRYSITCFFYTAKADDAPAQANGEEAASGSSAAELATACPDAAQESNHATASAETAAAAATTAIFVHAPAAQRMSAVTAAVAKVAEAAAAGTAAANCVVQPCSATAAVPSPRIFVSIAAFRDEECQWTLRDLFLQAAQPERVFVGVVWQVDPCADAAFTRMAGGDKTARYQQQVREVRLHYCTATGPCAARSLAQQLWAGEEYILQIDAHMRFVHGWDELCLQQLQHAQTAAASERVVLSTYPLGYSGQGPAAVLPEHAPATLLCAKSFDAAGMLRIQARSLRVDPPAPIPSYFWAAGFSFGPSAWLLEVPYCPHLPHLFFGEESYMLARMVTRGWQVYAPSKAIVFHQWERSERASSYQACVEVDMQSRAASQAKVLQLLCQGSGTAAVHAAQPNKVAISTLHAACTPSDVDWAPGGVWGLGTTMTLSQFEDKCGVWFSNKVIDDRALYGNQEPALFME